MHAWSAFSASAELLITDDNPDGKIGRIASEEVIYTLIKSKRLPVLLYGIEACPVNSAVRHSLQFALNRALLKNIWSPF